MSETRCLVVLPVGPREQWEHVTDTIQSVLHYCLPTTRILVLDDSRKGFGWRLAEAFERTKSIPSVRSIRGVRQGYNTLGSFWNQLGAAFAHALQAYDFDMILRIDSDSLVIGWEPELDAAATFAENPRIGLLGQHTHMPDGSPMDHSWPRKAIMRELSPIGLLRRWPPTSLTMLAEYLPARRNGYRMGDHVPGGAYFLHRRCAEALRDQGRLYRPSYRSLRIGDDHFLSLLVRASGFEIGDLSAGNKPIAFQLRDMPLGFEELFRRQKKLVHSVRSYDGLGEAEIRDRFRRVREAETADLQRRGAFSLR